MGRRCALTGFPLLLRVPSVPQLPRQHPSQVQFEVVHQLDQKVQAHGGAVGCEQALSVVGVDRGDLAQLPGCELGVPSSVEDKPGLERRSTSVLREQCSVIVR